MTIPGICRLRRPRWWRLRRTRRASQEAGASPHGLGSPREAELRQFLANRVCADRMPHPGQRRCQLVHTLRHPDQRPHRIAERHRLDQLFEGGDKPSVSATERRPPPLRRTCPLGSGSPSRSSSPRLMVERASPVILETAASPPHPAARASAAANKRRPRSSSREPTASQRCRMPSSSIIRPNYAASRRSQIPPTLSHTAARAQNKRFAYCSKHPKHGSGWRNSRCAAEGL